MPSHLELGPNYDGLLQVGSFRDGISTPGPQIYPRSVGVRGSKRGWLLVDTANPRTSSGASHGSGERRVVVRVEVMSTIDDHNRHSPGVDCRTLFILHVDGGESMSAQNREDGCPPHRTPVAKGVGVAWTSTLDSSKRLITYLHRKFMELAIVRGPSAQHKASFRQLK